MLRTPLLYMYGECMACQQGETSSTFDLFHIWTEDYQTPTVILPAEIPPIQTPRLLLRPLHARDVQGIFGLRSLRQVTDWLWPKVPDTDISQTQKWMAEKIFTTPDATGVVGRAFFFAIIRADDPTERIIGDVGINALDPAPSVGFVIHPEFWGQGYATEAVGGVVKAWWALPRKADSETQIEKLFAACNRANEGSFRVLTKNGFRVYTEVPMEGDVVAFLELECQ